MRQAKRTARSVERKAGPRGLLALRFSLFAIASFGFAHLAWDLATDGLAAEPVKDITHRTGWWALALLLATLAVTPLRRLTGWNPLIRVRRMLGLFAFAYATIHLLIYFGLDQAFSLAYIGEEIAERPYITVGFTAWLLLLPLAVTSTKGWIRRLGRRWQALHRLVYPAAALGVLHFYWLVKADTREPLLFAAILAILLGARVAYRVARASGRPGRDPRVRPVREAAAAD